MPDLHEPFQIKRFATFLPISAEMAAELEADGAMLRAGLDNLLDPMRPASPPPPDPGPNPSYLALVEAARDWDVLAELVELHEAKWQGYGTTYRCMGDHEGDDYTAWPCETVAIIVRHLGREAT